MSQLPLLCVICDAIRIRPATARFLVAGDSICADHVSLRSTSPDLRAAIEVATADIDAVRSDRFPRTKGA